MKKMKKRQKPAKTARILAECFSEITETLSQNPEFSGMPVGHQIEMLTNLVDASRQLTRLQEDLAQLVPVKVDKVKVIELKWHENERTFMKLIHHTDSSDSEEDFQRCLNKIMPSGNFKVVVQFVAHMHQDERVATVVKDKEGYWALAFQDDSCTPPRRQIWMEWYKVAHKIAPTAEEAESNLRSQIREHGYRY